MQQLITLFTIGLTIGTYLLSRFLFLRYAHPLLNVVFFSTILIIVTLLGCNLPYECYVPGKDIMTFLLGPATVALAMPLYKNRHLLSQYAVSIVAGVGIGAVVSMVAAMLIVRLGGLEREVVISIAAKSVTIPLAVEIVKIAGGDPSLTVAFVVATGTLGSAFGPKLLTWIRINDPVSRGLALGAVAHGQGVAMALMEDEQQGCMAGVAMVLTGIFTAAAAPFLLPLFL